MCRPPFANVMSSGWHLHQSLVDAGDGRNAFMRERRPRRRHRRMPAAVLSPIGGH